MTITCNGEPMTLAATIADLLEERYDDPRPYGVAVAVNAAVVPRSAWASYFLAEGDVVEVVTAVQGG